MNAAAGNEYTVDIAIHTARPLTEDALFDVAAIGGVSVGTPGDRRLETTLTVDAVDMPAAAAAAIARVTGLVPGDPISVEVMTTAEQDRRLANPAPTGP